MSLPSRAVLSPLKTHRRRVWVAERSRSREDCNSVAGYTVDAAVKNREKFIDLNLAMAGKGGSYQGKARLTTGGVTTNVRLEFEGGEPHGRDS